MVMPTVTREKRCTVCGTDVSQSKRRKDSAGNYFCESCASTHASSRTNTSTAATPGRACGNCGMPFGALQQGVQCRGHVVCGACAALLEAEAQRREQTEAEAAAAAAQRAAEVEDEANTRKKVLAGARSKQ